MLSTGKIKTKRDKKVTLNDPTTWPTVINDPFQATHFAYQALHDTSSIPMNLLVQYAKSLASEINKMRLQARIEEAKYVLSSNI